MLFLSLLRFLKRNLLEIRWRLNQTRKTLLFKRLVSHRKAQSKKLRVKCFCQVRNALPLIEDWIRYHLDLFGEGNLHLLDHESNDGTEEILKKYEGKISVRQVHNPFKEMGMNLTQEMERFKEDCDLLIPLDQDEFVCLEHSVDREEILKEFCRLDLKNWGIFKFRNPLVGVTRAQRHQDPLREITAFEMRNQAFKMKKCFFNAKYFLTTSFGNHSGRTAHPNSQPFVTPLMLFHFHWLGREHMEKKCLEGARSLDFWENGHRICTHWKEGYGHLVRGTFEQFFNERTSRIHRRTNMLADKIAELRKA